MSIINLFFCTQFLFLSILTKGQKALLGERNAVFIYNVGPFSERLVLVVLQYRMITIKLGLIYDALGINFPCLGNTHFSSFYWLLLVI